MARKTRSDIKVGNLEKKLGLGAGAITNPDGSDARSDKKLGTLREDFEKAKKVLPKTRTVKKVTTPSLRTSTAKKTSTATKTTATKPSTIKAKAVTVDQQIAAKRIVKRNPKAPVSKVKKVRAALNKSTKK